MADLILDAVQKFPVEEVLECIFSITSDLIGYAVELYHILVYMLLICHGQMMKLMLSITNRIVGVKICLEFQNELLKMVHP